MTAGMVGMDRGGKISGWGGIALGMGGREGPGLESVGVVAVRGIERRSSHSDSCGFAAADSVAALFESGP